MSVVVSLPVANGAPVSTSNPLPTVTVRALSLTETYVSASTSSAVAIVANTNRRFLAFLNNDPVAVLTFSVAATAVANRGIVIQPGGGYVFEAGAIPTNAFTVVGSASTTVPATILEG